MTEFVIVFPVLLMLLFAIVQVSMVLTARQVVYYAAYCSARAAIVYGCDQAKSQRAAEMACLCITPKKNLGSFFGPLDDLEKIISDGLGVNLDDLGLGLAKRYFMTKELLDPVSLAKTGAKDHKDVTATVTFHYPLFDIPVVTRVIDTVVTQCVEKRVGGESLMTFPIKASCTLPMEEPSTGCNKC